MPRSLRICLIIGTTVVLIVMVTGCTTSISPGSETPLPETIPAVPMLPTVPPVPTVQPIPTFPAIPTPEPLPAVPSISTADDPTVSCTADSDCVPAQCCHPTSCMNQAYTHACTLMCTNVCQEPVDCGAGHCGCISGRCSVSPGPSP